MIDSNVALTESLTVLQVAIRDNQAQVSADPLPRGLATRTATRLPDPRAWRVQPASNQPEMRRGPARPRGDSRTSPTMDISITRGAFTASTQLTCAFLVFLRAARAAFWGCSITIAVSSAVRNAASDRNTTLGQSCIYKRPIEVPRCQVSSRGVTT